MLQRRRCVVVRNVNQGAEDFGFINDKKERNNVYIIQMESRLSTF